MFETPIAKLPARLAAIDGAELIVKQSINYEV